MEIRRPDVSPARASASRWRPSVLGAALLTGTIACHGPRTAPAPVAAAPACPAPVFATGGWTPVTDSMGISYRLPPGFVPRPNPELPHDRWSYDDGTSGYVWIGMNRSPEHWITLRRVPSPGMYEMSECIDSLAGREILVQAWRMRGGISNGRRRPDRYDVFALLPIEPGRTVWVTSGGSDRRFQEMALAIVRTVRIPLDSAPYR